MHIQHFTLGLAFVHCLLAMVALSWHPGTWGTRRPQGLCTKALPSMKQSMAVPFPAQMGVLAQAGQSPYARLILLSMMRCSPWFSFCAAVCELVHIAVGFCFAFHDCHVLANHGDVWHSSPTHKPYEYWLGNTKTIPCQHTFVTFPVPRLGLFVWRRQ